MATYTSAIEYTVKGVDQSTGKVISLADAMAKLERKGPAVGQSAQKAAQGIKAMDVATSSALQRLLGSNQSIEPLRMGLASLATQYIQTGRSASASESAIAKMTSTQKQATAGANALAMGLTGAALVAAGYAGTTLRLADSYTSLQGQINVYADSAANAAQIEERLFKVAREARVNIEQVVSLYSRLAPAFKEMGKSQEEVARFTELVSKALTAQGATASETAASTLQLAQALGSGVLRGDEFKSMMEASPGLMRQIARGFEDVGGKIGVPVSSLRAMAQNGELTAEKVVAAVMRMDGAIEASFAKSAKTPTQAFTVLGNEMMRAVGSQMNDSGTTARIAEGLLAVAGAAKEVVGLMTNLGQVVLLLGTGFVGAKIAVAVTDFINLARATTAAASAITAMGVAQRAAATANMVTEFGALATTLPRVTAATQAQIATLGTLNSNVAASTLRVNGLATAQQFQASTASIAARGALSLETVLLSQGRAIGTNTAGFGSFNAVSGQAATVLPQVANAAGALTTRVSALTQAKTIATGAMNVFKTAGMGIVTLLGGPWSVAIMAAIGGVMLFNQHQRNLRTATDEYKASATATKTAIQAYAEATNLAAIASGTARTSALAEAAALREVAIQARNAAAEKLKAARATVAQIRAENTAAISREQESLRYRGANRGDAPGTIAPTLNNGRSLTAQANVDAAQAAIDEADKTIAAADRVRQAAISSVNTRTPATPSTAAQLAAQQRRVATQGVQGQQATSAAAKAEADAETDANQKLALSLEAVDKWRRAERAEINLRYADNPGAKAEALAAMEVQANAKRSRAHNQYEASVDRAARADEAAANRSEAAARRVTARREREVALVDQYQSAAEQARIEANASETNDLQSKLAKLDSQRDAEIARAQLRISDTTREQEAIAAIQAEYFAKRESATEAHLEKSRTLDEEANALRRTLRSDEARLEEGRANAAASRAEALAGETGNAGKAGAAARYIEVWNEASRAAQAARDRVRQAEVDGISAALDRQIDALKKQLGAGAEFDQRRIDAEESTLRQIANINDAAKDQQDQDDIARFRRQQDLIQAALERQIETVREQQREWYKAGEDAAGAFKTAVLSDNWDDLGNSLGRIFLEALYDSLINDPLRNWIKNALDTLFKVPQTKSEKDMGQAAKAAASALNRVAETTGQGGSTGSQVASSIFGTVRRVLGFADGGIMSSQGSMPLRAYANGGIANSPQLALFGEGRRPEAYVPLPDGRSIPVTMRTPYTDIAPGSRSNVSRSVVVNFSPSYNIDATGADAAGLARVEAKIDDMNQNMQSTIVGVVSEAIYDRQVA